MGNAVQPLSRVGNNHDHLLQHLPHQSLMARTGTRQTRRTDRDDDNVSAIGEDLSYNEAQTALELALAQLQASDLPVESMGELYLRARSYAQRCEQLLTQVEQSIALWDPETPDATPKPLEP